MNIAIVLVCVTVAFAAGVYVGRKYEQKIVAVTLAEFAKVDAEAKAWSIAATDTSLAASRRN